MTAPDINTWLSLLEASCAQASITCLDIIVDQCGSETPLLPSVLSVEPPLPWYSLFTGLPEEQHEELAPLLVRVDLTKPLQRHWLIGLLHHLDTRTQLLVLASHWPFQALAEHLGQCVDARHGGSSGLLRYYDTRLFPLLLNHVLSPEQQQLWLQPVMFWSWLDLDGAPQRLLGTGETAGLLETFGPIEFSDSQMAMFSCASDAHVFIRDLNPALLAGWGAEQQFQACYAAMLEATEAGLMVDTEREAFTLDKVRSAWAATAKPEKHRMPKPSTVNGWVALLCASGALLAQTAQASTIEGINHTHWAINRFSVDGRSGLDIIGPYQGGGGGCCYIAPTRWQQGMTVRVDWETGVAYAYDSPGYADWPKYLAWEKKIDAQKRHHSKVVQVPDYTGQKACGITVHFLPCDELEVTTSCYAYGSPEYPIKTPLQLPEPQSCPQ